MTRQKQEHTDEKSMYERYLQTDQLLSLQKDEAQLAHHDELQFQIVHQVFELLWKEAAFELRTIRKLFQAHDLAYALRLLQRVIHIQDLLSQNLRLLETMTPWEFHRFRGVLADGAGTDSPGFRLLLTLAPQLWDDFQLVLAREQTNLIKVYTQPEHYPLVLACAEALTDYDEVFQLFRAQHLKLARRMLGPAAIGTGGTPVPLLERTLQDVFYPELWEVRNQLTELARVQGLV